MSTSHRRGHSSAAYLALASPVEVSAADSSGTITHVRVNAQITHGLADAVLALWNDLFAQMRSDEAAFEAATYRSNFLDIHQQIAALAPGQVPSLLLCTAMLRALRQFMNDRIANLHQRLDEAIEHSRSLDARATRGDLHHAITADQLASCRSMLEHYYAKHGQRMPTARDGSELPLPVVLAAVLGGTAPEAHR